VAEPIIQVVPLVTGGISFSLSIRAKACKKKKKREAGYCKRINCFFIYQLEFKKIKQKVLVLRCSFPDLSEGFLFRWLSLLQIFLEVLACDFYVDQRCGGLNGRVRHDDHDISVLREEVYERRKMRVPYFHILKVRASFAATQFELFDDVAYFFESVDVFMFSRGRMRNDQEGGSFKEYNLICLADLTEFLQSALNYGDVGDHSIYYARPRLVEGLIPNRRRKTGDTHWKRCLFESFLSINKRLLALVFGYEIHFM